MDIKNRFREILSEGNYIVNTKDLDKVKDTITKEDPKAVIKVVDEEVNTDEGYNIYAVCNDSISKTAGTSKRSEWTQDDLDRYEKCVRGLKEKPGYKMIADSDEIKEEEK